MKVCILYFVFFTLSVIHLSSAANPTKAPFCNNVCPSEYNSICATNGSCLKVFNNECLMEAYNCRGQYETNFEEVDFTYCIDLKHTFCF